MAAKPMPIFCLKIVNIILSWSWLCLLIFVVLCSAEIDPCSDTISQGQQLRDWEYLRSANKAFRLQFFSPGTPKERYLGIFLQLSESGNDKTVPVWVANRYNPINDSSGELVINSTDGMLSINYSGGHVVITTTSAIAHRNINTSATLQDDGNFVLRQVSPNGSTSGILWQSFDHPTDTLLPGMKLGTNLKTGHRWLLTSWISDQSPLPGSLTLGVDRNITNQLTIWWRENVFWSSGQWHKDTFGNFDVIYDGAIPFKYISNGNENYFTYSETDGEYTTIRLNPDDSLVRGTGFLELVQCGTYSKRTVQPGCAVNASPKCIEGYLNDEVFYTRKIGYDLPFYYTIEEDYNLSIIDCGHKCKQNCSCYAYASLSRNGTACAFWDKSVIDALSFNSRFEEGYNVMYIRKVPKNVRLRQWIWLITIGGTFLLLLCTLCIRMKCKKKDSTVSTILNGKELLDTSVMAQGMLKGKNHKMNEIHQFSFETIEMATNNFSVENKLGEGGFGPVYKGELLDGQEIAIKRLSKTSSQGLVEFKNEIQLIVMLQHNNLVRLLGCCIHQEELMLVYDYMPNKSLDFFLFDSRKGGLLKWADRMNIIEGIAQGLLYLHRHSRLRIIHRDLKASNILLDLNMTPKISDFGMARIFGMQDSEANTKRIVGTHGYMSPEYAIKGVVSTKIDVFSFGVLILEIVSGKKNHKSYHSERPLNLIGLAWELWIEGRALDLIDTTMDVSNCQNEVQRCINVGLLCVQDNPIDRPSMADVILMLKNELLQLRTPKQPAFFIETRTIDKDIEECQEINCTNKLSTSIMEAR